MNNDLGEIERYGKLLADFDFSVHLGPDAGDSLKSTALGQEISNLLTGFIGLPEREKERGQTLLEISGYPHLENVCSNILAFFLDPNKEHGLGDIVLRALLEAAKSELASHDLNLVNNVQREAQTQKGNRIDITIEGETFTLGIENKLFAGDQHNPFGDYAEFLESKGKKTEKILLCLDEQKAEKDLHGFRIVTYDQFFDALEPALGKGLTQADQRYLLYLIDFVVTIRNLKKGPYMDTELLEFLSVQGREETSVRFCLRMIKFESDLRARTKEVVKSLEISTCFNGPAFWSPLWQVIDDDTALYAAVNCTAYWFSGLKLTLEARIRPKTGWIINTFVWSDKSKNESVWQWLRSKGMSCDSEGILAKYPVETADAVVAAEFSRLFELICAGLGYRQLISDLVRESKDLVLDDSPQGYTRFALKEWDDFSELRSSMNWTTSNRILLFEFERGSNCLNFALVLGPGPDNLRKRLFKLAKDNKQVFRGSDEQLSKNDAWTILFQQRFLPKEMLTTLDEKSCNEEIRKQWALFVKSDLPLLGKALRGVLTMRSSLSPEIQ